MLLVGLRFVVGFVIVALLCDFVCRFVAMSGGYGCISSCCVCWLVLHVSLVYLLAVGGGS